MDFVFTSLGKHVGYTKMHKDFRNLSRSIEMTSAVLPFSYALKIGFMIYLV